jgi:UDP-N-acetylglucosamine 2-epimerase (non-hydrolysing)/GDP/UDP-N,N'-diacetylbacillosamine 2-epimerase (hydrolysing)
MSSTQISKSRKICVVTSTRADYGLLYWLLKSLKAAPGIDLKIIATGTHLSPIHGMTVNEIEQDGFTICERVSILSRDDSSVGVAKSLGRAVSGFADAFYRISPDIVVLLGDRYEILGAAQAAMVAQIPIAHIHGGETTQGAIDEAIRHSVSKMAHLHFVAAPAYRNRVLQLGEDPSRVWTVGALALDNISKLTLLDRDTLEAELGIKLNKPSLLVTYHPMTLSHDDQGQAMEALLTAVDAIGKTIIITGVNADVGGGTVREMAKGFAALRPDRVCYSESLGKLKYLSAIKHVDVVVGNSSSGLIEAPSLGTPTVDVGDRQKGRLRPPSVIHCSSDAASITKALGQALHPMHRAVSERKETPYGFSGAAQVIATVLHDHPLDGILIKPFYDYPSFLRPSIGEKSMTVSSGC